MDKSIKYYNALASFVDRNRIKVKFLIFNSSWWTKRAKKAL